MTAQSPQTVPDGTDRIDRSLQERLSQRKARVRRHGDRFAEHRSRWIERNRYFHAEDLRYMQFLAPKGLRVLDVGCGTGDLLAALEPDVGVGLDISAGMVEQARRNFPETRYPNLSFRVGDTESAEVIGELAEQAPFDVIFLADTIGSLEDVEATLAALHPLCDRDTRIVIAYYSQVWTPILQLAERLHLKMPQLPQNWLSTEDIAGLLGLADFEVIKREWRLLVPRRVLGLGPLINRSLATLPIVRRFCLRNYLVARSLKYRAHPKTSATVVIPCRNERGNIEDAVTRLPQFCDDLEILFVEGHSKDGTLDEIKRVIEAYPERDIVACVQPGKGKGDAVRHAFNTARGDVLMILDADLTVPPEKMPRFYEALVTGQGEFINGSRLIYPMEKGAMRFLNNLGNRFFSVIFTWLLNQRFTDTLCGTKALSKKHYEQIAANRAYFGEFDPFGDFDLIFGAAKLNLKVVEIPVRYASRNYGTTQISRFSHGWLLLRMVMFAFRKFKAF